MKTIGLLGGMSCESSAEYYRFINEEVRDRFRWPAFDRTRLPVKKAVELALD